MKSQTTAACSRQNQLPCAYDPHSMPSESHMKQWTNLGPTARVTHSCPKPQQPHRSQWKHSAPCHRGHFSPAIHAVHADRAAFAATAATALSDLASRSSLTFSFLPFCSFFFSKSPRQTAADRGRPRQTFFPIHPSSFFSLSPFFMNSYIQYMRAMMRAYHI
jgi:hypothetical protein